MFSALLIFRSKFRSMCTDSYGLDAAHYYTAPCMAWDATLKLTNVKLDLVDNEVTYTRLLNALLEVVFNK